MAKSVKDIEDAIRQLPQEQLRQFHAWYEKFNSDSWDKQIEKDISAGKLDALADASIEAHNHQALTVHQQ